MSNCIWFSSAYSVHQHTTTFHSFCLFNVCSSTRRACLTPWRSSATPGWSTTLCWWWDSENVSVFILFASRLHLPRSYSCINVSVLSGKNIPFWAIKNSWGEDYGEQVRQAHLLTVFVCGLEKGCVKIF